ncbi:MAG: DUF4926 domain-containing protein [Calditrichaeota bacterium]|nr:DUF4926 domain-containing protein [Calditrichota bacterium]
MIGEFAIVALLKDLPEYGLEEGDLGTVVHIYDGGEAFEVEFMTFDGNTIAVATIEAFKLHPVGPDEVPRSRHLVA